MSLCRGNSKAVCPFYLLGVATVVITLLALYFNLHTWTTPVYNSGANVISWLLLLAQTVADAIVVMLPLLLLPRRWRVAIWLPLGLLWVWCIAQLMYYPTYQDLMPFSSFLLWQNLDGLVVRSAVGNLQWRGLTVMLPMLLLWLVYRRYYGRKMREVTAAVPGNRMRSLLMSVGLFLLVQVVAFLVTHAVFWHREYDLHSFVSEKYTHVRVSHASYMTENGLISYIAYCVAVEIAQHHNITPDEERQVQQFIDTQPHYADNIYDAHKQNLILVIVESLNSWVVDLRIDGREITPVLNALCRDTTAIVGLRMQRQVQNGGSSDAHFMYNTGLLPLEARAVSMVYGEATYPTLVQALGKKTAVHICGDKHGLWNAETTARTYGFDRFVGDKTVRPLLNANDWKWERCIFGVASTIIDRLPQPFFAQVVTLGMHEPYVNTEVPETWISESGAFTPRMRVYLERTAVFDQELGLFLQRLRDAGLYDNSLIVIASDHTDYVDNDPKGRMSVDPVGNDCVLVVLNSGHGRVIKEAFGQIDLYPTLLDLMGANHYAWKGVGRSLMRGIGKAVALSPQTVQNAAEGDLPNGAETAQMQTDARRAQEAWEVSRLMITSRYFTHHKILDSAESGR